MEYNQIEPLLISSGFPEGDANEPNGFSRFAGNINELIFDLPKYAHALSMSGGTIDEFINPKVREMISPDLRHP